jgi:hypothetical protein
MDNLSAILSILRPAVMVLGVAVLVVWVWRWFEGRRRQQFVHSLAVASAAGPDVLKTLMFGTIEDALMVLRSPAIALEHVHFFVNRPDMTIEIFHAAMTDPGVAEHVKFWLLEAMPDPAE